MNKEVMEEKLGLMGFEGEFSHICVIVKDIKEAMKKYQAFLNVEEPKYKQTCPPEIGKVIFRGEPTPTMGWQAFFTIGGVRVELIEPDEHPSTWKEHLETKGETFHHISYTVKDLDLELERFAKAGMPMIQIGNYNGGRYAYMDTESQIGIMLEIMQNN